MLSEIDIITAVELMDVTRTRKAQERVESKVRQGLCIIDGCDGNIHRRGLCTRCYYKFNKAIKGRTKRDKASLVGKALEAGMLLRSNEERSIKSENVFADL